MRHGSYSGCTRISSFTNLAAFEFLDLRYWDQHNSWEQQIYLSIFIGEGAEHIPS